MDFITTDDEIDALPLGSTLVDKMGDVWMVDHKSPVGSRLISPETQAMPAERVMRKYGPLTLVYRPDRQPAAQPAYRYPVTDAAGTVIAYDLHPPEHYHRAQRPERVVKAEALRDAAVLFDADFCGVSLTLRARADQIEAGA